MDNFKCQLFLLSSYSCIHSNQSNKKVTFFQSNFHYHYYWLFPKGSVNCNFAPHSPLLSAVMLPP
jgi:hypothetical protein